jgi:hypothetical protein
MVTGVFDLKGWGVLIYKNENLLKSKYCYTSFLL